MEQRILVPLDGSDVSEAVLPKVEDFVLRTTPTMDAEVTLLNVISKMNYNMLTDDEAAQLPFSDEDLRKLTKESKDYLEKVAKRLRRKGIKVKTMVSAGRAADEIIKAGRQINAHIIAMSTHGRPGIVRRAIGSVTDEVIRLEGTIPVLAVKASGKKNKSQVLPMESLQSLVKHGG